MLNLKPFQEDGVRFLASNDAAILGDDTGLGKTAQLIRAADVLLAERILILCQPISVVSWRIELPKWQVLPRPVHVVDGKTKTLPDGPAAIIVPFSFLSTRDGKALDRLFKKTARFAAVIIDECQDLKSPTSARTKAVYGGNLGNNGVITRMGTDAGDPPKVWLSSATITPNHVGEIYPHLRALFPQVLEDLFGITPRLTTFEDRFCHVRLTDYGRKVEGNNRKQTPVLRARLDPFMLVRSKKDVLGELDPVMCLALPLDLPKGAGDMGLGAVGAVSDEDLFAELMQLAEEQETAISSARRNLGIEKAKAVWPWIENFLATGKQLVVFAHHRDVINMLTDLAGTTPLGVIDGRTSPVDKGRVVEQFQNKKIRLLLGQTKAAGTSITLTAASDVLIVEPDWTPANNYQAISRCHRMGQTEPVTAYFAFAAGTLDERITQVLRRKAQDAALFYGKEQNGGHI